MSYNAIAIPLADGDQRWLFSKKVRVEFSAFRPGCRNIVENIQSAESPILYDAADRCST
jgi:hypothetical protein